MRNTISNVTGIETSNLIRNKEALLHKTLLETNILGVISFMYHTDILYYQYITLVLFDQIV